MHFSPFYAPEDNDREAPRSYSQDEVDQLINERLSGERESHESALQAEKAARAQAEGALQALKMRDMAQQALLERHLPAQLMTMLRLDSEETLTQSLAAAESAFRAAIEEGVRTRLRGAAPSAIPLEAPRKPRSLSYRQAADLYKSDRAAYEKQFGGM